MKTTIKIWLIGILLCLVFGPRDLCQAGEAADAVQAGSTWQDNAGHTLIIVERIGETYRGRFTKSNQFIREVTGSVAGDKISWLAKDVSAIKGGPGGDNFGTIRGNKIDFKFTGDDGKIASVGYSLTRVSGGDDPTPAPSTAAIQTDPNEPRIQVLKSQAPNAIEWALAPLNRTVPTELRQNLTLLREDLLDEAAKKPAADANAYKLGERLCNALIETLDERENARVRAGYTAAQAQANIAVTNQALEARRRFTSWPTYQREKDQREELRKEKQNGAALVNQRPILEWADRGAQNRKVLDALYAQYREAARRPATKS